MPLPEMISVVNLARKLNRSPDWVRRQIKAGRLRAARVPSPRAGGVTPRTHLLVYVESAQEMLGLRRPAERHQADPDRLARRNAARARLGLPLLDSAVGT